LEEEEEEEEEAANDVESLERHRNDPRISEF